MPPDGSCLFHAIAFSIYNATNFEQTQFARATIVNYIYDNWDEFNLYTSNARGDPFCSREEYKVTMLQSSTCGGTAEVKAAGFLFPARYEVYERDTGILRAVFGREGYPKKRLLFTGNLSSGHYNFCSPVVSEESTNNTNINTPENLVNYRQDAKVKGRPKSEKSRLQQACEGHQLQVSNKLDTPKSASISLKRKAADLKNYNRAKKCLSRNEEGVKIKEKIKNRLLKIITSQRSQQSSKKLEIKRSRDTVARRVLREDPFYREDERARDTAAHRVSREDPLYRERERARDTVARRVLREDPVYREDERARDTAAHHVLREDPVYRENERARNIATRRVLRKDPVNGENERTRDTTAHRVLSKVRLLLT